MYYQLLAPRKHSIKTVLEIGVGNVGLMRDISGESYLPGASLRVWRDFFPNAVIYGLDIDKTVLFNDARIQCFYTDQSSAESLLAAVAKIGAASNQPRPTFDLIVDDGSHDPRHMILTFSTLNQFLSPGGLYIIEDIRARDLDSFLTLPATHPNMKHMQVAHKHLGIGDWDSFVAYQTKPTETHA